MGQNQVALAMCILDTTRYPRFANVARKPRYPEGRPSSGIQTPQSEHKKNRRPIVRPAIEFMVENRGFEPLTS